MIRARRLPFTIDESLCGRRHGIEHEEVVYKRQRCRTFCLPNSDAISQATFSVEVTGGAAAPIKVGSIALAAKNSVDDGKQSSCSESGTIE